MKQSQLFAKTQKQPPKDEQSINSKLLIQGDFIYKEMAGAYSFLPLGVRVLEKIENIVREEMNNIRGQEILMTVFQPKQLWEETGRWSKYAGKVMYTCKDKNKEIGLGATHEEMLTDIVRHRINSYADLPLYLYQIQTKFRKELRAKSGLLRGREFLMKDLYSFHSTEKDFQKYYEIVKKSYFKIFKRCGLSVYLTEASGAGFTKDHTHEFQVIAPGGEDTIIYCEKGDFAENKEIAKLKAGEKCLKCKHILKKAKSIEVGNIFPLGTRYSKDMKASFIDQNGKKKLIIMGSYGIGIGRTMGAVVEIHHDQKGILWPKEISPFQIHLLQLENTQKVRKAAEKLYQDLSDFEVLYDDRVEKTPGEKFADCDLVGIPIRLVVSERTLLKQGIEMKKRNENKVELIKIQNIKSQIKNFYV